jgi:Uncharacterized conserved protein
VTAVADNGDMAENLTARKPKARDLNELVRYTMWSVFRVTDRGGSRPAAPARRRRGGRAARPGGGKGIVTRGCYDIQGLRADADFMFWWVRRPRMTCRTCTRASAGPASAVQRAGLVGDGAAPPGRVQQEPHPAFLAEEEPRAT